MPRLLMHAGLHEYAEHAEKPAPWQYMMAPKMCHCKGAALCCMQHAQRRLFVRASIDSRDEAYKCALHVIGIVF